jgi:para-aminobenzoate synthetase/4-amino-4-deoxychorismate lyase
MLSRLFNEKNIKSLIQLHLNSPFVFLETALVDKENRLSFLFTNFSQILIFNYYDDVEVFFQKIEDFLKKGYWICGYFSYEFGYFLEPALSPLREKFDFPLAWLGICKRPIIITSPLFNDDENATHFYSIRNLTLNITEEEYNYSIKEIKKYLEQGLTYQVNFTFKVKFDFEGDILNFYLNLRRAQPTSYMALMNTQNNLILSFSPELFFRLEKNKIIMRPMKGTLKKEVFPPQDKKNKIKLRKSRKIKAENVMIVDLIRNDLGKVSKKVKVSKLFEIENYRTLYQMTSTVEAKLRRKIKIKDIFHSLFPSGSVTGAPKIKTMQLIKKLEKEPRNIYTGCIGYFSPENKSCFNVAIRTILIKKNRAELGIGGGIVYDSIDKAEYKEALLKAKFLTEKFPAFSLIESILWEKKKGYFLLDLHLRRLKKSSQYFCIPLDIDKLKKELKLLEKELEEKTRYSEEKKFKIRVLVSLEGKIKIESRFLKEIKTPVKVKISSIKINPNNVFLYHKTTRRELYNKELKKAKEKGFFEVIFLNIYEELTEGAITNIFVLKENILYTPPLRCGLLGGVLREYLLKMKKAKEKVLFLKDLKEADKIFVGNSVRGLMETEVLIVDSEKDDKIKKELYITYSHK